MGAEEFTPEFERMVAAALSLQWGDNRGRLNIGEAVMAVKAIESARVDDLVSAELEELRRCLVESNQSLSDYL